MTKKVLVPTNEVFTVANMLLPAECAEYIALSEDVGYTIAPITTRRGFEVRPEVWSNERVILNDPELAHILWQRVSNYLPSSIGRWRAVGVNEHFRFYRYDPGQRFAVHHDGSYRRPNGEESLLTLMIYLNEDFEGGETRFDLPYYYVKEPNVFVVPVTGMALCFVHELAHEGTPLSRGRKYVLRSDVMYSAA